MVNSLYFFAALKPLLMKQLVLLLLLPLWIIGCAEEKEQPLTKEEAIAIGNRLQASVEAGHSQLFDSLFMNRVFADRIAQEAGESMSAAYKKSLTDALQKRTIGREMLKSMGADDTYEFLRHYEKDQRHHLIFRMYGSSGINYHDIELVKINNRIGLADMFVYMTGENFSKTLARAMELMTGQADKKSEDSALQAAKSVQEIRTLMNRQQYEKASQLYEELPASFKKDKTMQLMHISIVSELDQAQYHEALGAFEKQYGQDPSAQLALFDLYFLNEDYDKSLKVLDVLDASIQGDPVLNLYRSIIYTRMEQPEKSVQCLEALYKAKPDFENGVLELIANYIEVKNNEKAEALVTAYRANKKFDQEKLENLKYLYPDFAALN